MPTFLEHEHWTVAVLIAYFGVLTILAVYGIHRYQLVYLYFKHGSRSGHPAGLPDELPKVTVQLPVYNEMYVVERLIDSVCALDYPWDKLEIQILDDSDDETRFLCRERAAHYASRGFDISHIRRPTREGFKAGALQRGLELSAGELVAVFDADFVPSPDTLRKVVGHFEDPAVGMVQIRWGHLNPGYSILTRVQSILLDGHFVLESGTRHRSGRFFNFNGTAGIWRRQAIDEAGGWQHDTLTEDLDLSYRAQLRGWKFVFVPDFTVPGELPVEINAFKSQQFRWAKGSIQTARKLLPTILRSPLSFKIKLEAFFHLTANCSYPLMIALSLLVYPALLIRSGMSWYGVALIDFPLFFAATLSVSSFYLVSQFELYSDWRSRIRFLPLVLTTGIGLSVTNSRAVFEGLAGRQSPFIRTPKYAVRSTEDRRARRYRVRSGFAPAFEIALGLYLLVATYHAATRGLFLSLPFVLLFAVGFLHTGLVSILPAKWAWSAVAQRPKSMFDAGI